MDVGDHTTTSDGSLDQSVKFFVTADRQLEVTWGNALHFEVLAGVAGQFEDLSSEVFKNSCCVNSRSSSNTAVRANSALQESVDASNRELYKTRRR